MGHRNEAFKFKSGNEEYCIMTNKAQLEIIDKALNSRKQAGQKQIGWKLGFGSPAALKALNTSKPLIGGLFDAGEITSGTTTDVREMTKPSLEAEIAAYIGSDIPKDATDNQIMESIESLVPAIELIDFHTPPSNPETILADNIFQRGWVMFPSTNKGWSDGAKGLEIHITQGDQTWEPTTDIEAKIGSILDGLIECNSIANALGRGIMKGDIILLGSVIPPHPSNSSEFSVSIPSIGEVSLNFQQ